MNAVLEAVPTTRSGLYRIAGRTLAAGTPDFADAIAAAHAEHRRPRCLCRPEGPEMYVARLGEGYIVKRMPDTGCQHAPDCPSFEPPAGSSGLGQVLGSAITEDPATGQTTLKLDFPLLKIPGRTSMPAAGADRGSVASQGTRLSLRGLLHYLWDQAELTHWQPGFAGKRNWATVRKHLLLAAENKLTRGDTLRLRLYIPEVFSVEQRDALYARCMAQWAQAIAVPGKPQQLMLLVGEVKEIVPGRFGYKAVVKHLPDQAFAVDEALYRRLGRHFETELTLWGASDDVHMVMVATFSVAASGIPSITELSLMPVTRQWIPVEDGFSKQLVDRLVAEDRCFVKGLRYNLDAGRALACATLTDCKDAAPLLFIVAAGAEGSEAGPASADPAEAAWYWQPTQEAMPVLPPRRSLRRGLAEAAVR